MLDALQELLSRQWHDLLAREGLTATARIIALGLVMDAIYQFIAFRAFYPLEAIIVALGLAFVPYMLARGPIARTARWWRNVTSSSA